MPTRASAWCVSSISAPPGRNGHSAIVSTSCCAAATPRPGMATMSERTPSQTVGPFLHIALAPADYNFRVLVGSSLAGPGVAGVPIEISGAIRDGDGNVLPDALVEIWQADSDGRYPHPADGRPVRSNSFRGFGRAATDAAGQFHFATVKPGAVPAPGGGLQAPHINVGIFARGLLKRLFTRIYFAGERSEEHTSELQ